MSDLFVRDAQISDAEQISKIYSYYVENDICTFEEVSPGIGEMEQRISAIAQSGLPFLVAVEPSSGLILGYAYGTTWKPRLAYRYTVETTVYTHKDHKGKGVASILMKERDERLIKMGVRVSLGGITQTNEASVRLHEKHGYTYSGTLKNVGFKFGKWLDVGYWQKTFPEPTNLQQSQIGGTGQNGRIKTGFLQ